MNEVNKVCVYKCLWMYKWISFVISNRYQDMNVSSAISPTSFESLSTWFRDDCNHTANDKRRYKYRKRHRRKEKQKRWNDICWTRMKYICIAQIDASNIQALWLWIWLLLNTLPCMWNYDRSFNLFHSSPIAKSLESFTISRRWIRILRDLRRY